MSTTYVAVGSRFKTGEKTPVSGDYRFDGHPDGTTSHTPAESLITLSVGETFPPCRSCNKAAYWKLERRSY